MKKFFFVSGRVALYYGLKSIGFKKEDEVLLPSIICEEALIPFRELNINFRFYKVNEDLFPIWEDIKKKKLKKVKAILMIHYFGFPNDVNGFLKFKKIFKKIIIEDYSHGLDGKFQNLSLGKIGNISILSPRKILPINSGGILQINNKKIKPLFDYSKIEKYYVPQINQTLKNIKNKKIIQKFKLFFKKNFLYKKIINQSYLNKKMKIDNNSYKIFKNKIKYLRQRHSKYKKIHYILEKNKFKLIYEFDKKINPWHVPFYIDGKNKRNRLNDLRKIYKLNIIEWPKFPKQIKNNLIKKNNKIYCATIN